MYLFPQFLSYSLEISQKCSRHMWEEPHAWDFFKSIFSKFRHFKFVFLLLRDVLWSLEHFSNIEHSFINMFKICSKLIFMNECSMFEKCSVNHKTALIVTTMKSRLSKYIVCCQIKCKTFF